MTRRRQCITVVGIVGALAIIAGAAAVILLVKNKDKTGQLDPPNPTEPPPPSDSLMGRYTKAAISCDSPKCAQIGRKILEDGGKIADAAIAGLLCMGVIHSQSMGLGGGFLMVYYDRASKTSTVLNARESAPAAADSEMYKGNASLSATGPLAVAVPGEMKGYWELYNKFGGGVRWNKIIEPTIDICENGFEVDVHTANALKEQRTNILREPTMSEIFVDPETEDIYKLGDTIHRPVLAQTLRRIANDPKNGGNLLYQTDSELAQWLAEDLEEMGGIMNLDDLANYTVNWEQRPIQVELEGNVTLHTVPPPGGGVIMAFIMRILDWYKLSQKSLTAAEVVTTYHLILEAFKHAYAKRTILGDPVGDPDITDIVNSLVANMTESEDYLESIIGKIKLDSTSDKWEDYGAEFYQKDDHGTSHISIIGPDGDAISITSTVNLYFGARIRSNRTGIIYNDEMDDFSAPNITNSFGVPPSPNNFILPGKRPLSSMCPAIFTDSEGDVRLVVGTAGGTRITSATAYVAVRNLWFNETIKEAIDARRIHHQLAPMEADYEYGFLAPWVTGLEAIGHKMVRSMKAASVTMGVARSANGSIWANCDYRKPCSIDGY